MYVSERRIFRSIDFRCKESGFPIKNNKVDLQKAMKVKMKITIEFLVEIYFRNDLQYFEKYFTWGNIQPSRDFLDTLYIRKSFGKFSAWHTDGTSMTRL